MSNTQTLEEQLAMIHNTVYSIKDIENPFEEVQLKAVKTSGLAIKFIKNPSEEVQLSAIKNNTSVIRYIKNPTEKTVTTALESDLTAIKFITNYTDSKIIRKNWGTYDGKLILFQFKGIKYVNIGCFTTNTYEEFKTRLKTQQEKYSEYFKDTEDIQLILKEVKEYLTK